MKRNFVIMTKSKKGEDGYCVAGLDLATGDWIRLNVAGEYSFPRNLFCFNNNQEIEVMDTVSADIIAKDDSLKYQPENYYCNPSSLQPINASCEHIIADRVAKDKQQHKYIFYNDSNRVLSETLEERNYDYFSLMLIEPDNLIFRRNDRGRLAASFEYNGVQYRNIRVTDLKYTNSEVFPINVSVYAKKRYYLAMSLGEKFYNPASGRTENWKFVAAVIEKEKVADRYGREDISLKGGKEENIYEPIDVNEVIIKANQIPGKATFYNYDELKKYIQEGLVPYNNTDYSIANVDKAIADLAVLKSVRKKLTDKRKELEAAYTLPIKGVLDQLDSLIDMVKEPYTVIDKMLKNNAKNIKEREIRRYAYNKAIVLDEYAISVVESPAFFNQRWKNASYSERNWKKDVDAIIDHAVRDIEEIKEKGGENKGIILAYYFNHLSLDGIQAFIRDMTKGGAPGAISAGAPITTDDKSDTGSEEGLPASGEKIGTPVNMGPYPEESSREDNHTYTINIKLSGNKGDVEEYLKLANRFRVSVTTIDHIDKLGDGKNNRRSNNKGKKEKFYLTREEQQRIVITDSYLPISEIAKAINNAIDSDAMKKISYKALLAWLVEQKYIVEEEFNGSILRRPTEKGELEGVKLDKRISATRGEYYVTLYSPSMQRIIIENVNRML